METLALPELTNMAPPKSEEMSSDDIAKDVSADDATIIIDWAQDDREVSGLSPAFIPRRLPPDPSAPSQLESNSQTRHGVHRGLHGFDRCYQRHLDRASQPRRKGVLRRDERVLHTGSDGQHGGHRHRPAVLGATERSCECAVVSGDPSRRHLYK